MKFLPPIQKSYTDVCGVPIDEGKVYAYLHGTQTLATLYGDSEGSSYEENPYKLDVTGSINFFVDSEQTIDYIVVDGDGRRVKSFYGIKANPCERSE